MNERHLVMREVASSYYEPFPYLLAKCKLVAAFCVSSKSYGEFTASSIPVLPPLKDRLHARCCRYL